MEAGVYEIEGKLMYAQVFDAATGPVSEKRPEVHEKYLMCSSLRQEEKSWDLRQIQVVTRLMRSLMKEILFFINL